MKIFILSTLFTLSSCVDSLTTKCPCVVERSQKTKVLMHGQSERIQTQVFTKCGTFVTNKNLFPGDTIWVKKIKIL
jgi:hypothetical protein